jgi:hypothetical protein
MKQPPLPLVASQDLANQILRWFAGESNQRSPARALAGAVLYGPHYDRSEHRPYPALFSDFLSCLRLTESCQLGDDDFNRVRLISPEWNAVVDSWEAFKRIAHANRHREPNSPMVTFQEKEARFNQELNRVLRGRQLEAWTVPVCGTAAAAVRASSVDRKFEFLGETRTVKTFPSGVLPPHCIGVMEVGSGNLAYMLHVESPAC